MKMKSILLTLVIALILCVLIITIFISMLDSIAKSGIEQGATYALGVKATLNKIHIALLTGQIDISKLNISNPEGFPSEHIMKIKQLYVKVKPTSLFGETIHVKNFILNGLDINIDQKLTTSNVSVILNNIKKLSSQEKQSSKNPQTQEKEKKLFVNTITVQNVIAHFNLDAKLTSKNVTVKIPTIILQNVSSEDSPIVIRQLVMKLIPAIFVEILKQSKGLAPDDIIKQLDSQLENMQYKIMQKTIDTSIKQVTNNINGQAKDTINSFLGKSGEKTKRDKKSDTLKITQQNRNVESSHKQPVKKIEQDLKQQGNKLFNGILNSKKDKPKHKQ